jgi:hypothetical protein
MQPHAAMWEPHPHPLRTNVMTAAGCDRTDGIGEACVLMDDDASTPQARANDTDNLLDICRIPLMFVYGRYYTRKHKLHGST